MAKHDTLQRLSEIIFSPSYLGFNPTSNSTKPPHIANGLFRGCTGETCDTRDVHKWIVSEDRRSYTSSENIIDEFQEIFENGYREKPDNIKDFRFLLGEIFDQDNTVYPNYDFSVMTQSSHWMIKERVSSEAGIGDFLFSILRKELNGQSSPAIEELQHALAVDTDDITRLVKPIIAFPSENSKRTVKSIESQTSLLEPPEHWDSCRAAIRAGFDQLTKNIQLTGERQNNLLVLRRYVNFSLFATLLYLSQIDAAVYGSEKPPIVIDAGCELESIRKASEQSFIAAKKAVESYYINALNDILTNDVQYRVSDTDKACHRWIEEIVAIPKKGKVEEPDKLRKAIESYYKGFCAEQESPRMALSKALQLALYTFQYKSSSPSDFCRVLGVRGGLVGPKGNRATNKRYLINSFTLETLLLSTISSEELAYGIDLKELSQRLVKAYNILIGADPELEYEILEKSNIAQSTPGDLRGDLGINAQQLAATLISLGLGKSYADGVTLIGWRL